MDFAKDSRGRLIETREALPHRYYTCPVCSADVFLRRGHRRAAHFAHRSGHGTEDCELFHPSGGISQTWTRHGGGLSNDPSPRPIESLALSIELEPESEMRDTRRRIWGLRLTVPRSGDDHGQISVDCGGGPPRRIALSKLFLSAQTYPADLDALDFGVVWTSPEVRPDYKTAVEERLPGLDRSLLNIFAATTQKYKPRVSRLHWGSSYYFIWRAGVVPSVHDRLPLHRLADQRTWCCAFTSLPADEDAELKSWIEGTTGAIITPHRRAFAVLFPPAYGVDLYGRILVPSTDDLVLGINLPKDDHGSAQLGGVAADISLEGGQRHLVHLTSIQSIKQIRLTLDDTSLPPLFQSRPAEFAVYPEVLLSFRFFGRTEVEDVPLRATRCSELLRAVRRGDCEVMGCEHPAGVKGILKWRVEGEVEWNALVFHVDRRSGRAKADKQQILSVNEVLRQHEAEIEFDFGPFGRFCAQSERAKQPLGKKSTLPTHLRNRILWLLKTAKTYTDGRRIPVARLQDSELIALLAAARFEPSLAAHRVSLERQLSNRDYGSES